MHVCLLIYSYFPFGGQQRDFMRIAQECLRRGHRVQVFAFRWQGGIPEGLELETVPLKGLGRLARYRHYTRYVNENRTADVVVGFNKMPGLDVYFAADSCFAEKARKQRGAYYRFTPRYQHFTQYEASVFGRCSTTRSLVLSQLQLDGYVQHFPDALPRLQLLPPGLAPDRKVEQRDLQAREELRAELGLADDEILLLQVGSGFRIKGVDRSLLALASLPLELRQRARYLLIGQDRPNRFRYQARRLGLQDQVDILDGRDDIPRFFAAADLLLHPAYSESAGYVLLEAAVAGLPVLTTASCGYSVYIEQADAGLVCTDPFQQQELNQKLEAMLTQLPQAPWSANGLAFGRDPALYRMPEVATDFIEQVAAESAAARSAS